MIVLSYSLSTETPVYGQGDRPRIRTDRSIDAGHSSNSVILEMSNHTGTHIDCPYHFDNTGKKLTDYSIDFWKCQKGLVYELETIPEPGMILDAPYLENSLKTFKQDMFADIEILFLKTGWCHKRNEKEYSINSPGFDTDVAKFLKEKFPSLRFFGFDLVSISSYVNREKGRLAHKSFLAGENPLLVIEDVNLLYQSRVQKLEDIYIAPLLLENGDGAPVTIFVEKCKEIK